MQASFRSHIDKETPPSSVITMQAGHSRVSLEGVVDDVHNASKRARLNIQETTVPDAKQFVAEKLRVIQMRHFASNEYAAGLNSLQDAVRNLVQHTFQSKHVSVARRDRAVQLQRLVHNLQDTALQLAVNVQNADAQKQPLQTGALFQLPTGPPKAKEDRIKELLETIAHLRVVLDEAISDKSGLQAELDRKSSELDKLRTEDAALKEENAALKKEMEELTKHMQTMQMDIDKLFAVDNERYGLGAQVVQLQRERDKLQRDIQADVNQAHLITEEVHELEQRQSELKNQVKFLNTQLEAQNVQLQAVANVIDKLEKEKTKLNAAEAARKHAEADTEQLQQQMIKQQALSDALTEEIERMKAEKVVMEAARAELQDELNDLQTGIGAAAHAIAAPANRTPTEALVEALKTYVNPNDPRRQALGDLEELWRIAFDIRDRIMKHARDAQNCGDVLFITNTERQELLELYSGCPDEHKQHLRDALKQVPILKCLRIQTLHIAPDNRADIRLASLRPEIITPQDGPQPVLQPPLPAGQTRPYTLHELYTFLTNDTQNLKFLEESEQWQEALQNAVDTIRANLMAVLGPVAKGLLTSSDDMVASKEDSMIPAVLSEEDHVAFLRAQWLQYINTRSRSERYDFNDLRNFIYQLATALVENLLLGARWVKAHNAVFDGMTALLRETFERGKYMRGRTNVTLNAMIYGLFMSPTENAGCRRARVALGEVLQQRQLQSRLLTGVKINTLGSLEYRKQADRAMIAGGIFFNKFICSINYDDMPSCTLSA